MTPIDKIKKTSLTKEERLAKEKLIKKGQEDFAESESDWVFPDFDTKSRDAA